MAAEALTRPTGDPIDVRPAAPNELDKRYRFRYEIYVDEMGRKQRDADHEDRTIRDPLDDFARDICAWSGDRLVGAVRLNLSREGDLGFYEEFYDLASAGADHPVRTAICTRLMIAPDQRGGPLAVRFCCYVFEYLMARDVRWLFIDCNRHLLGFFQTMGYREHLPVASHPEYGPVHRLRIWGLDRKHLERLDSPLLASLRRYGDPAVLGRASA